ncbi:MAG: hypothetical protein AABW52_01925 [Nanoarchaeota archaeon]
MRIFHKILIGILICIILFLGFIIYDANNFFNDIQNNPKVIGFYDSESIYFAIEIQDLGNFEEAVGYDKEKIDGIMDSKDKVIILIDDKGIDTSQVSAGFIKFEKDSIIKYLKTAEIDTPLRNYITLYSGDFKVLAFGLLIKDLSEKESSILLNNYDKKMIKIYPDKFSLKIFRVLPKSLQLRIIDSIIN